MRKFEELFNRSLFSRFLNSSAGRIFRQAAGAGFLIVGYVYRHHALGVLLHGLECSSAGRRSI